jgi:hypothetical protein
MALSAPIDTQNQDIAPRGRGLETWACVILAAIVGWSYVWTALQPANSWVISSRDPNGYYTMETAGFRSGHLYAAITPHPALLALKDPYDPVANAPYRVHDMSLYKGHYYLYYGVTPVFVLFWPFVLLTGQYLSEPFAVALFCTAAVWTGMGILLAIRRRHFPQAPFAALLGGWLCLAWATPLTLLVIGPQFYQVPISCAIFLQALMLAAAYRAMHSPAQPLLWLGAAGLLFGLSVGARPNYLAGFVVLLVPIAFVAWGKERDPREGRPSVAKALLWTFTPAALCGFGLLWYNWARFGSVAEFGMHYQLAGEKFINLTQISLRFLLPHIAFYLFTPGQWQSYFPYFSPAAGQPYGFLRYLPWSWLLLGAFLRPARGEAGERAGRLAIAATLALAFATNLAFLACFFGTTARYPGDFANAALILAGVGALALGQRLAVAGRAGLARLVTAAAAAVALAFAFAVYVDWLPRREIFLGLARAANWPAYAWDSSHGSKFGGLRLDLRLPAQPPVLPEPLFETGREGDRRDWLEIDYLPKGRARLSFFHAGTGHFPSREFTIPADRRIVVEARCGSLLPPFGHPVYAGWSREEYDDAKHDLRLTVNGEEVLRLSIECYESSPANTTLGRLAFFSGGMQQAFTGSILGVESLPLAKPLKVAPLFSKAEPVELSLYLPTANQSGADPLLVTGSGNQSDLVYCVYDGANHVKFALDHFGSGGPVSESVHYDPLVLHKITIWMGSMAAPDGAGSPTPLSRDRLTVVFDGRALLNVNQVFYPSTPSSAIMGFNAYGSTGAGREFTGKIAAARQVDAGVLPPLVSSGKYGAVEMSVNFPYGVPGTQEPLVVTGVEGAGDFVYVRYIDPTHVLIGFDHWGIGGIMGEPFELDYGQTHRIAISFQALFPPGSALHESKAVRVLIDGKPALVGSYACHPTTADRIMIGANPIGGSTCGPKFTGRILSIELFPEPRE